MNRRQTSALFNPADFPIIVDEILAYSIIKLPKFVIHLPF